MGEGGHSAMHPHPQASFESQGIVHATHCDFQVPSTLGKRRGAMAITPLKNSLPQTQEDIKYKRKAIATKIYMYHSSQTLVLPSKALG